MIKRLFACFSLMMVCFSANAATHGPATLNADLDQDAVQHKGKSDVVVQSHCPNVT